DPDLNHARGALAHLQHLVVQDIFLTETCSYADVILPASAWPEKDGTVTNTNRQVQMGRQALPLPGEARQDLWIIQDLAQRIGCKWNYTHVSEVFTEMADMMPALANITWDRVAREDHVTYPVDGPDVPGRDVVFDKGFPRPGGFAKLVATKYTAPDEMPDAEYPFILTTGRQLEHWHTGAMTRRASVLDALEPSAIAAVSRGTIRQLGIEAGDMVRGSTRSARRRSSAAPSSAAHCGSQRIALSEAGVSRRSHIPYDRHSATTVCGLPASGMATISVTGVRPRLSRFPSDGSVKVKLATLGSVVPSTERPNHPPATYALDSVYE